MSKRVVRFDEEALARDNENLAADTKRFKNKHSLDSDEEDDQKDVKKLDEDEIEGQEDDTETYTDDGVKITPFNLREELEEGYFDAEGNYFVNRDKVNDVWLDTVDWQKVKEQSSVAVTNEAADDKSAKLNNEAILALLKELVTYLQPKESPLRAIRRYGGNKYSSASEKWKLKKKKDQTMDTSESTSLSIEGKKDNSKICERLTEITDLLFHNDKLNIHHDTLENINYQIKSLSESAESHEGDEVLWCYKWKNERDAKIYGPYTSLQMLDWTNEGYFLDGVFVRRADKDESNFYSSKRIDFDLFT